MTIYLLSISISICEAHPLCEALSLSPFISICEAHSLCEALSLSLSLSAKLTLSARLSLYLHLSLSAKLTLSARLSLYLHLSLSLYFSISLFLFFFSHTLKSSLVTVLLVSQNAHLLYYSQVEIRSVDYNRTPIVVLWRNAFLKVFFTPFPVQINIKNKGQHRMWLNCS